MSNWQSKASLYLATELLILQHTALSFSSIFDSLFHFLSAAPLLWPLLSFCQLDFDCHTARRRRLGRRKTALRMWDNTDTLWATSANFVSLPSQHYLAFFLLIVCPFRRPHSIEAQVMAPRWISAVVVNKLVFKLQYDIWCKVPQHPLAEEETEKLVNEEASKAIWPC